MGAFNLSFDLQDENNESVADAAIYINTNENKLTTNEQGKAVLKNIPDGTYEYRVEKENYISQSGSVQVMADTTLTLTLTSTISTKINSLNIPGVEVYPNPFDSRFMVKVNDEKDCRLKIYSATGNLILDQKMQSTKSLIDLGDKEGGIYILEVIKGKETYQSKIIKQ